MKVFHWSGISSICFGFPSEAIGIAETVGEAIQQIGYSYDRQLKRDEEFLGTPVDDEVRAILANDRVELIKELLAKDPVMRDLPSGFLMQR